MAGQMLLAGTGQPDLSRVTHVVVGFSAALLPIAELLFGPGQVLFLEEPDVARARQAEASCAGVAAVAGVVEARTQHEQAAEQLPELVQRPPGLRAVFPGVEYGVVAAAVLAEHWGVPGPGVHAARVLRDKAELRKTAGAAGIPQPDWAIVTSPEQVETFRARHGGRCVVKPTDRQGSLGVELIGPADDVHGVWAEVVAAQEPDGLRTAEHPPQSRYLAEELVSGLEISVQALVSDGRVAFANATLKDILPGRYPIELAHTVPAPIPGELEAELVDKTRRLVEAAGFRHGMVHAEWIAQDGEPYLIECAARIPGDGITFLIDYAYGVRLLGDLMSVLEGGAVTRLGQPVMGASIRFAIAEPGVVTKISGVERAWAVDEVVDVRLSVAEGSAVRPLRCSLDRIGSVVAVAPTAAEARDAAAHAVAAIQVRTAPAEAGGAPVTGRS